MTIPPYLKLEFDFLSSPSNDLVAETELESLRARDIYIYIYRERERKRNRANIEIRRLDLEKIQGLHKIVPCAFIISFVFSQVVYSSFPHISALAKSSCQPNVLSSSH